ncbi:MAG: hypothetical protein JXB06_11930 [Spirochaetales bacterium]|nr:hypothetical protein [Spirochaetales bacterium]
MNRIHPALIPLFLILVSVAPAPVASQDETSLFKSIAVEVYPGVSVPFGSSGDLFTPGGNGSLSGAFGLIEEPLVYVSAGLDYDLVPLQAEASLSILGIGVGVGAYLDFGPRLSFRGFLTGGPYYPFFNQSTIDSQSAVYPYISAGIGLSYLMTPAISLGANASYRNFIGTYGGLGVQFGCSFYLRGQESRRAKLEQSRRTYLPEYLKNARQPAADEGIRVNEVSIEELFPVLHKYYDQNPIGTVLISNQEPTPVTDVKVSFFIKQYMASPKASGEAFGLEPGEQREVTLYALLNESVLEVTEATKVTAEVLLEYKIRGTWYSDSRSESVRIYDRNAMTWDDNRKACAFVTAKDPAILGVSKFVSGIVRNNANPAVNLNIQKAMGVHEALGLYGINYEIDPQSAYDQLSRNPEQIDYVQFPRQTMEYKAGDCDDLSILYAAMLESIGVETAFITVPGHIYMAFATEMSSKDAANQLLEAEDLIIRDDRVWIPLEVTERDGDFLRAWQGGAQQWRQYAPQNQADFYPIRDAWVLYEPVGSPGIEIKLEPPAEQDVVGSYEKSRDAFLAQIIFPKIQDLERRVSWSKADVPRLNRLGILYAQFGDPAKATGIFERILTFGEYVPALINLGNVAYMRQDWPAALGYYERAQARRPDDGTIKLNIARTHHAMENYGLVKRLYEDIQKMDPALAERFAYLGAGAEGKARAEAISQAKEAVLWEEE